MPSFDRLQILPDEFLQGARRLLPGLPRQITPLEIGLDNRVGGGALHSAHPRGHTALDVLREAEIDEFESLVHGDLLIPMSFPSSWGLFRSPAVLVYWLLVLRSFEFTQF